MRARAISAATEPGYPELPKSTCTTRTDPDADEGEEHALALGREVGRMGDGKNATIGSSADEDQASISAL